MSTGMYVSKRGAGGVCAIYFTLGMKHVSPKGMINCNPLRKPILQSSELWIHWFRSFLFKWDLNLPRRAASRQSWEVWKCILFYLLSSSYFDRAVEEWRQFHCDLNDLTQWMAEAEELLAESSAPDGSLDLEKALLHQQVGAFHQRPRICRKGGVFFSLVCGI